jgi:hypothetical protein
VKLHTINKEKPTKELVGRERETAQEKSKNITQKLFWGLGICSMLGKMT